jgi:CHAD domain-containing protein
VNLLTKYTNKHSLLAISCLQQFAQKGEEEPLHQLRVNVKKIKAVVSYFVAAGRSVKKVKHCKKALRVVFREAGIIREAQLTRNWLNHQKYYELWQQSKTRHQLVYNEQEFIANSKKYLKLFKKIQQQLTAITSKDTFTLAYVLSAKENIDRQTGTATVHQWHELRRQIKQFLYAVNWLSPKEKIKAATVAALHYFDELQELIGTWHDLENIQQWLNAQEFFLSKSITVKWQYNHYRIQLQKEIEQKEKKISTMLKKQQPGSVRKKRTAAYI